MSTPNLHHTPLCPTCGTHNGKTLLDEFAGQAMTAIIGLDEEPGAPADYDEPTVAASAYKMGIAMVAEKARINGEAWPRVVSALTAAIADVDADVNAGFDAPEWAEEGRKALEDLMGGAS